MHCVKEEHTAINMNLHYLDNGTVMLNFIYHKELFFIPLGFALKVRIYVMFTDCVAENWRESHRRRLKRQSAKSWNATSLLVRLTSLTAIIFCSVFKGTSGLHRFPDLSGDDQGPGGQLLLQELCLPDAACGHGGGLHHPREGPPLLGPTLPGQDEPA